jgi:hypothetical protein
MDVSRKPDSTQPCSTEIRLAIREEVERRFDSPPASFVKQLEEEVHKRISRQERFYWAFIGLTVIFAAAYTVSFWHAEMSQIPDVISKQLQTAGAVSAQKEILNALTNAQGMNSRLNNIFDSTKLHAEDVTRSLTNLVSPVQSTADRVNADLAAIPSTLNTNLVVPLGNRLEQLKRQDNILLVDDLPKLFVREFTTNLVDNNTIILSYEPIPSSVKIYVPAANNQSSGFIRIFPLQPYGYCQGTSIVLTNASPTLKSQVINPMPTRGVEVEYVRKSLH